MPLQISTRCIKATTLALVAYNAGQYSDQIKQLKRLENMSSRETSSYVVKYNYIKEKVEADDDKKRK